MDCFITNLQLRLARWVLNLGVREIGSLIQVSRTTISKLEQNDLLLKNLKFADRRNAILLEYFKQQKIHFPDTYTAIFLPKKTSKDITIINDLSLTRFQLRAARAILNKDRVALSKVIGITRGVLECAESYNNIDNIQPQDSSVILQLKEHFATYGIEFPDNYSINFKKFVDEFYPS